MTDKLAVFQGKQVRRVLNASGIELSTFCRQLKPTYISGKSYKAEAVYTEASAFNKSMHLCQNGSHRRTFSVEWRWNQFFIMGFFMIWVTVVFGNTVSPAPSSISAKQLTSVFNEAIPVDGVTPEEIQKLTLDDLKKDWFQVPVTTGNGDMLNPVFLPFEYICHAGKKDVMQPLTFPCLLSFKFDFVPDNFSARHPGFIYRKKRVWDVKVGETQKIADYISYWTATHAFGGKIVQNEEGYTGQMLVYDCSGKEILNCSYAEPVPYFTLMGQMVKSWMEYRKQHISEGLYTELVRPMTTDMECVRLYGHSFYKEWRTDAEWEVYEEILRRDPDFAEVRHWYANQKSWTIGRSEQLLNERGKALQSHLVIPALMEFDSRRSADRKLVDDFYKSLDYAERICGDGVNILSIKLETVGNNMSFAELDELLGLATKNPNSYPFLRTLAWEFHRRSCYEVSIPLYLSAIHSGYLKGSGSFEWEWNTLSSTFFEMGYPKESIYCAFRALQESEDQTDADIYWRIGNAYREFFQFKIAAQMYQYSSELKKEELEGSHSARMCIYMHGDLSLLDDPKIASSSIYIPCEVARKCLATGQFDEVVTRLRFRPAESSISFEDELIQTDLYLLTGNLKEARKFVSRACISAPRSRQVAYLIDHSYGNSSYTKLRYAKVGAFMYKNDPFWCSILDKLDKSIEEEDLDSVFRLYQKAQEEVKLVSFSSDVELKYWQQFDPFEIEYICMRLLKDGDPSEHEKIFKFYLRYSQSLRSLSTWQKAHTRLFYVQLLGLVSDDEKKQAYMSLLK